VTAACSGWRRAPLGRRQDSPFVRTDCVKPLFSRPVRRYTREMRDLIFLGLTVAFFALAVLMVRGCALILRPDSTTDDDAGS
jgi:hypothetical protein